MNAATNDTGMTMATMKVARQRPKKINTTTTTKMRMM